MWENGAEDGEATNIPCKVGVHGRRGKSGCAVSKCVLGTVLVVVCNCKGGFANAAKTTPSRGRGRVAFGIAADRCSDRATAFARITVCGELIVLPVGVASFHGRNAGNNSASDVVGACGVCCGVVYAVLKDDAVAQLHFHRGRKISRGAVR